MQSKHQQIFFKDIDFIDFKTYCSSWDKDRGKFYTDIVQQTNRCNYYHLVFIMHVGWAGAPQEVRCSATDFHRSRLELAKGSVREILIILPVRERNEQAWSATSRSVVKVENKCELGLEVMALVIEITRDSGSHPGSVTQCGSEFPRANMWNIQLFCFLSINCMCSYMLLHVWCCAHIGNVM